MKPLVKWLKVKRVIPSELKLVEKVNNRVTEPIPLRKSQSVHLRYAFICPTIRKFLNSESLYVPA